MPPTIQVPAGASWLTVWFSSASGGCTHWDSDYAANYNFSIAP